MQAVPRKVNKTLATPLLDHCASVLALEQDYQPCLLTRFDVCVLILQPGGLLFIPFYSRTAGQNDRHVLA